MSLIDQLKLLYGNGLHSNVVTLGSFLLSISENHQDGSITPPSQYQTMVYMGKSLQYMGEYRRGEAMFKKALQFVKMVTKNKSFKSSELFKEGTSEIDVKFAISECNIAVREFRQAVSILESIPQRHRTARVNMALGKLYQQGGMERPAIVAYKEVLKECPLALEAIQELLALGVLGAEISSLMINFHSNSPTTDWYSN
ncbi:UNVERIFIED_CONTAM: hypothetical protein GTU68_007736 [Idotea baltica]|nr:hypothetical protein [Idotea baltica]